MPYHGPRPTLNNHEHTFDDQQFLVSKTDVRGVITYANSLFIRLSGYTEDELLGGAHNMVRHPDMPKAAFADLWATVGIGKEWRGIVKNLARDGGFYWVDAMVTPSYREGTVVGFMSVRRKPSLQQVSDATYLYRTMRQAEGRP